MVHSRISGLVFNHKRTTGKKQAHSKSSEACEMQHLFLKICYLHPSVIQTKIAAKLQMLACTPSAEKGSLTLLHKIHLFKLIQDKDYTGQAV